MNKKFVISGIALLVAAILGCAALVWRGQAMLDSALPYMNEELSQTLGMKVALGRVRLIAYNEAAVDGLTIYDAAGQRALQADTVRIEFSLWKVLSGRSAAQAVKRLQLVEPELSVYENTDGSLNINELVNRNNADNSFIGIIDVDRGLADIRLPQGHWQLSELQGTADFTAAPAIKFYVGGQQDGASFTASGQKRGDYSTLRLHTDGAVLAKYDAFIPRTADVSFSSGELLDISAAIEKNGDDINYSADGRLQDAAATIAGREVEGLNGLVGLTTDKLYLYGITAGYAGQQARVGGTITLDTSQPVFDLTVAADSFDVSALGQELPVAGKLGLNLKVRGTVTAPEVSGQVALQSGTVAGYAVTTASIDFSYADNIVKLQSVHADIFGGTLAGSGLVNLAVPGRAYDFTVQGDADGQALEPLLSGLTGRLTYRLHAAGIASGGSAAAAADGAVSIPAGGSFRSVEFSSLQAGFRKTGEQVQLDYLTVHMGDGVLLADGSLGGNMSLNVRGQGLPLAAVPVDGVPLDGTVEFMGTVTGSSEAPQFNASFTADNGTVAGQPFTLLTGRVSGTDTMVLLDDVVMKNGQTRHVVNGSVGLTGDRQVNLSLTTENARAEDLIGLLSPGEQLTGWVDNRLLVRGTLADPEIDGEISMHDGSFRGYLVEKIAGTYARHAGVVTLRGFNIKSLNTQIALAGTIDATGNLDIGLSAQDIDFAKLQVKLPYPLTGIGSFNGHLAGTSSQPIFTGRLCADGFTINGQSLTKLDTNINVKGMTVAVDGSCLQGSGHYAFDGGFNMETQNVYGALDVTDAQLAPLLAMAALPVKDFDGRLNGQISLHGTLDNPTVLLSGTLQHGTIRDYSLDDAELDIALEDHVVSVNRFVATQGKGRLVVRGRADLNGDIDMEAGGYGLDAGIIPALFGASFAADGSLQFAVQVTGKTAAPNAAASLEIDNGNVAGATFDKLYGLFVMDKDNVHVNQLYLAKGPYKASAYGVIPLKALKADAVPDALADQMNLTLKLDQANLSILPLLSKDVAWAAGPMTGEVTIGGTLAQPTANGQLTVDNGAVKIASIGEPLQKVGVDIRFEGDKIIIQSCTGQMGGGSYSLTGAAAIRGQQIADYNLKLSIDNLGISHAYFHGPLNGNLTLTDVNNVPKLAGQLRFENVTVNIPTIPQFENSDRKLALDVELLAGKKVRLHNPYLYDIYVAGKAHFNGTLDNPQTSGRIHVVQGTVSYLRTQFKIDDGLAVFGRDDSFLPMIHLSAETTVSQIAVKLNVDGPLEQMVLKLTSDPAMRQDEILSLLTLRSRFLDKQRNGANASNMGLGRDEVVAMLDAGLQMRFVSAMEDMMKDALGLDQFRLVKDTLTDSQYREQKANDHEVYNLEIGKYITDKLMLSYILGVDHKSYEMGFQYDITRKISLTGSLDEQKRGKIGVKMRFYFK